MSKRVTIKRAKLVEELDTMGGETVTFPKHDPIFVRYREMLREVIAENFGYSAKQAMQYDNESQTFYWRHEAGNRVMLLGETRILFECPISIDPKKMLGPQIEAAKKTIAEMEEHHRLIYRMLYRAKLQGEITSDVRF